MDLSKRLIIVSDDLPVIRDNIKKGFLETQSKVNSWVTSLKKKIDGEDEDDFSRGSTRPQQAQTYGGRPLQQYSGRKSGEFGRRSVDRDRYDADPQVLGDDFTNLELKDHEGSTCMFNIELAVFILTELSTSKTF